MPQINSDSTAFQVQQSSTKNASGFTLEARSPHDQYLEPPSGFGVAQSDLSWRSSDGNTRCIILRTASSGGSGGSDMNNLEQRVFKMEDTLGDARDRLKEVEIDVKHIKTNMVTKGQVAGWALVGLLSLLGSVVGGLWWVIQQYLAPMLHAMPHL
ncbi:hypothetical protein [Carnimonas bestiolae]|uniref:hypothetical protein n=1 Tax=Carnimonas bestiolae TaxID=3402172 RepID=UPI003F4ADA60